MHTADDLPALHSLINGLRRDQDAVTAGLTLNWSSGPVEGNVNRIKTIKRQITPWLPDRYGQELRTPA